jgi:hypothetical protein
MTDWIENTTPGSPREGQYYYDTPVVGGVWHTYKDGTKEFIATGGPDVVSTGGVPGVPTYTPPAAPAPAPAPTPPPAPPASTPSPASSDSRPIVNIADNNLGPLRGPVTNIGDNSLGKGTPTGQGITPPTVVGQTPQPTTGSGTPPGQPYNGPGGATAPSPASSDSRPIVSIPDNNLGPLRPTTSIADNSLGKDTSSTPGSLASGSDGTAAHSVATNDSFWRLESANGWPHGTLERLNPGVNPHDLQIGSTIQVPSSQASTGIAPAPPTTSMTPTATSASVEFPKTSSYPGAHEVETAVRQELAGWADGTGNAAPDPAKNIIEAATKTETDPLKINTDKSQSV